MIALSLALLGYAVADLVRWSPQRVPWPRAVGAITAAAVVNLTVSSLAGFGLLDVALVAAVTVLVVGGWVGVDYVGAGRSGYALAWIAVVLIGAFAITGWPNVISGSLERWYRSLPFEFVDSIAADQFALGIAAALFLLATANRVVRLLLDAAGTPAVENEEVLRGGRLLGPLERLAVAAMVLAGDVTGAAIIIAAKGLLRLPEVRSSAERQRTDDQVTEYLLIGTFASLLLAGGLSGLVLAAS
jgi:hypothetical protein